MKTVDFKNKKAEIQAAGYLEKECCILYENFEKACRKSVMSNHETDKDAFIHAGKDFIEKLLQTDGGQRIVEEEKKIETEFLEENKEIFQDAPDFYKTRIQYFAGKLIPIVPLMCGGNPELRMKAQDDFGRIYSSGIDQTFSKWLKKSESVQKTCSKAEKVCGPEYESLGYKEMKPLLLQTLEKIKNGNMESMKEEFSFILSICRLFWMYRQIVNIAADDLEHSLSAETV